MPLLGSTPDPLPTRRSASKQSTPAGAPGSTMFETIQRLDPTDALFGAFTNSKADIEDNDALGTTDSLPTKPVAKPSRAKKEAAAPRKAANGAAAATSASAADNESKGRRGRPKQSDLPQGQYEVADIIQDRPNKDTGKTEYRIRWKGYSTRDNTWEPEENLVGAEELLKSYKDAKKKLDQKRKTQPAKKRAGWGQKYKGIKRDKPIGLRSGDRQSRSQAKK